jgi:hypothetical protein
VWQVFRRRIVLRSDAALSEGKISLANSDSIVPPCINSAAANIIVAIDAIMVWRMSAR